MRRNVVVSTFLSLMLLSATALADQQVVIEHVSFDEETMELSINADLVDSRGLSKSSRRAPWSSSPAASHWSTTTSRS